MTQVVRRLGKLVKVSKDTHQSLPSAVQWVFSSNGRLASPVTLSQPFISER